MYSGAINNSRALEWRDLSEQEIFNERALRIGLAVGAIILAIGMAIAIYYCCTTTYSFTNDLGELIERTNAELTVVPAVFGSVGLILMLVFAAAANFEVSNNGSAPEDTPEKLAATKLQMRTASLENIYNYYYRKGGGLGPLVRSGILTVEQGNQLRTLLSGYHTSNMTTSEFEKRSTKENLDKEGKDSVYGGAKARKAELEEGWNTLQQGIKSNSGDGL